MRVALTFDVEHPDRPQCPPGVIDSILDALAAERIRSTFFVQGRWAEAYPTTGQRLARDGHVVGSHSFYHARLPVLTDAGLDEDLAQATDAIRTHLGVDPRPWFRCPFGAGADDPRVLAAVKRAGFRHVGWDIGVADYETVRTPGEVVAAVVNGVRARMAEGQETSLVLLHSWPAPTRDGLRPAIEALKALGASFVAIGELPAVLIPAGLAHPEADTCSALGRTRRSGSGRRVE